MQKGQDAAAIIIIDNQNRVLLVRHTYGKQQWAMPGGMVEDGEPAWDGAVRELKEELNISAVDKELSGVYYQAHKNRYIYTFKAYNYQGNIEVDNVEIDQYGFFSIDDLPRPISSFTKQRLIDAVTSTKAIFREEYIDQYGIIY